MEEQLPTVGVGEKVLTQPGHEGPRTKTKHQKQGDKHDPPMNQRREQALVGVAETLKAALEQVLKPDEWIARSSSSVMIFRFEQVQRQRRNQRA